VLAVLRFSDKEVRRKLFEHVDGARGLLLVTAVRASRLTAPVPRREPFASLERAHGEALQQVVVADEGTVEGMWRDPVGDLADALFPDDRNEAYAAANGYLLFREGRVEAILKKRAAPAEDAWFIEEALAHLDARIPAPDPARRPGSNKRKGGGASPAGTGRPKPAPRPGLPADPWVLLGITRDTPRAEARRAFRTLIAQYHPDKVAHLAPEFRELAEERTRQILEAWERVCENEPP
jgi:DnaJ-domain-containing protein 1